MSDFGADVIKIEPPRNGDPFRDVPKLPGMPVSPRGIPGLRTVMSPIHVEGETQVRPRQPPKIGEHTDEVLRSAGYDDDAIRRLRAAGVIS